MTLPMRTTLPVILLLALVSSARAQAGEKPGTTEIPPFERGTGEPVAPAGAVPSDTGALDTGLSSLPPDFNVPGAQIIPEGTYLPRVVGRAVRTARGEVVFAPDATQPDTSAALPSPLPLMVLLPSVRRDQLASALTDDPLGVASDAPAAPTATTPKPYTLAGQVYVYHGRTYLLCSTFAALAASAKAPDAASATDAHGAVDQLITELERAGDERRVLTPGATSVRSRDRKDDAVIAAMTEGSVITSRRGRLLRLTEEGGRLAFVVDNDPDSPALPALVLLPCQVLEEVESVVAARGPEVSVKMSGRIVTAGSKASLLPVFFQVERRADITPGQ
jgi:hypothetical protein